MKTWFFAYATTSKLRGARDRWFDRAGWFCRWCIVHGSARASLGVAVFFVFVLAGGAVKRYELDINEIE